MPRRRRTEKDHIPPFPPTYLPAFYALCIAALLRTPSLYAPFHECHGCWKDGALHATSKNRSSSSGQTFLRVVRVAAQRASPVGVNNARRSIAVHWRRLGVGRAEELPSRFPPVVRWDRGRTSWRAFMRSPNDSSRKQSVARGLMPARSWRRARCIANRRARFSSFPMPFGAAWAHSNFYLPEEEGRNFLSRGILHFLRARTRTHSRILYARILGEKRKRNMRSIRLLFPPCYLRDLPRTLYGGHGLYTLRRAMLKLWFTCPRRRQGQGAGWDRLGEGEEGAGWWHDHPFDICQAKTLGGLGLCGMCLMPQLPLQACVCGMPSLLSSMPAPLSLCLSTWHPTTCLHCLSSIHPFSLPTHGLFSHRSISFCLLLFSFSWFSAWQPASLLPFLPPHPFLPASPALLPAFLPSLISPPPHLMIE